MIPLLAQATAPSHFTGEQLGVWVAIALALAAGAVNVKLLFTRKPPLHREFASRDEHEKLEQKVGGIDEKFEIRFREFSQLSSQSRKELYKRVEQMDASTRIRIDELDKRLDSIPQRVLELLNTTRQYHTTRPPQ